jgi:hypothetical protein
MLIAVEIVSGKNKVELDGSTKNSFKKDNNLLRQSISERILKLANNLIKYDKLKRLKRKIRWFLTYPFTSQATMVYENRK